MKLKVLIAATLLSTILTVNTQAKNLAIVNGEPITEKDMERAISTLPYQLQGLVRSDPELKKKLLNKLIEEKLLLQEMRKSNIKPDDEINEKVSRYRDALLLEKFLNEKLSNVTVSETEIREYYEKNKDEFKEGEKIKLAHIIVKDEEKLEKVISELKAGKDFAEVASKYSEDKETQPNGGYIGEISTDELNEMYKNILLKTKPGEFTAPIKTDNGYQIIKVIDRIPEKQLALEDVKESIKTKILSIKQEKELERFIDELKSASKIEVLEK